MLVGNYQHLHFLTLKDQCLLRWPRCEKVSSIPKYGHYHAIWRHCWELRLDIQRRKGFYSFQRGGHRPTQVMESVSSMMRCHEDDVEAACQQLAAASLASAAVDDRCTGCAFDGAGRNHCEDGSFYCFACWEEYEGRKWPLLGGRSEQFKKLTADYPVHTFALRGGEAHPRFGMQRLELLCCSDSSAASVAELRASGTTPSGRIVLGFDCESKPSFTSGQQHPICLIQLATPSLALLFRISARRPLPDPLQALLEDDQLTLVGMPARAHAYTYACGSSKTIS